MPIDFVREHAWLILFVNIIVEIIFLAIKIAVVWWIVVTLSEIRDDVRKLKDGD